MLGSNTSSENCDEPTDILLTTGLFIGPIIKGVLKPLVVCDLGLYWPVITNSWFSGKTSFSVCIPYVAWCTN